MKQTSKTHRNTHRGNLRWLVGKIAWAAIWITCSIAMFLFVYTSFYEYIEDNPVTIVTFVDRPEQPGPVVVKICNKVPLDEQLIKNYNGTGYHKPSIDFLEQTVSWNESFNHAEWAVPISTGNMFLLSSRIFDAFKLDISMFTVICSINGRQYSACSQDFEFYLDLGIPCFRGQIHFQGYGRNKALVLGFVLHSSVKFGKHTGAPGLYVSIHHPDDYVLPSEGIALGPTEYAVVTATTEEKVQKKPFAKAKCVTEEVQSFEFTGEPFEVPYHPRRCTDLCFIQGVYKLCNCSYAFGSSMNNTQCIENHQTRGCLARSLFQSGEIENLSKDCMSLCLPKCNQKNFKLRVFKERNKYSPLHLATLMKTSAGIMGEKTSRLASELLNQMEASNDSLQAAKQILENAAQLIFYFRNEQQMIRFEVIQLMTFSTFLSNVGGLMGMWLGLSVISVLKFLEPIVSNLWKLKLRGSFAQNKH